MMTPSLEDFDGLLSWGSLQMWIEDQDLPGKGPATAVSRLAGGTQNSVFLIERGSDKFVLRRPGKFPRANGNATMIREASVLAGLAGSDVPHPKLYAQCDNLEVIGTSFYVMESLDGFSPWGRLPGKYAADASWRHKMGIEITEAAAKLAAVDYRKAGLSGLGKADQWHERQVLRWIGQLERYDQLPGYTCELLPFVEQVADSLGRNIPTNQTISIIHGDLNLTNTMFSFEKPKLAGLIDWELTTLGDPLIDLGWILASWWSATDPIGHEPLVEPWEGFVSRQSLVDHYGSISGRDMSAMPWFFALSCLKLASILEGNFARSLSGLTDRTTGQRHHSRAQWLLVKAVQIQKTGEL